MPDQLSLRDTILNMLSADRFTAWHGQRKALAEQFGVDDALIGAYTTVMVYEGLIERNGTAGDFAYRLTDAGLRAQSR